MQIHRKMPPISKPKVKCIKFGEILIDESKKVVLLCVNCSEDFSLLTDFCKHLKDCEPAKHVFQLSKPGSKLLCDTGNLLSNVNQKSRELLIYGVNKKPIASNICDIEAEILNPRWYTDAAASSPIRTLNKNSDTYNNLIEEVTPFVQFKENVRTPSTPKRLKILQSKVETDVVPKKKPPLPNATATAKANSTATNPTNTQHLPKRSISGQTKPACAKSLSNISAPNTVRPTLKRKPTTLLTNQPTSAANTTQFAAPTAVKRPRNSAETFPIVQQKPAINDKIPKPLVNQINCVVKTQPQTLKIHPQITINTQHTTALQKPAMKVVPSQKPRRSLQSQSVCQTLPKPVTVSTPTLVTAPIASSANNKITVDILNKLQTLGLKVERTNPAPKPPSVSKEKNSVAMEIIKKLQSKGMEIKRVPKTSSAEGRVFPPQRHEAPPKPSSLTADSKYIHPIAIKQSTSAVLKNFLVRKSN